jgi:hypothetical protein
MKMIKLLFIYVFMTIGIFTTSPLYAKAPYIDYMYTNIEWSLATCLNDSRKTMKHAGFTETGSTGNHELLGIKGDYKSVIVCIDDNSDGISEMTFFIVSGPSYKKSAILNRKQKEYWDSL